MLEFHEYSRRVNISNNCANQSLCLGGRKPERPLETSPKKTLINWYGQQAYRTNLKRGHIHQEPTSWIFYRKLAADCARANVSLHGFSMLWERSARECLNDMHWLEKYLVTRGGRSKPSNIEAPTCEFSDCSVDSVVPCKDALLVEKRLLEDLERLCSLAEKSGKTSLAEAIKARLLRKEAKHVKNMGDLLKQVARVSKCPGLGLHILDMELRNHKGILPWTVLNDPDRPDEAIEHGVGPISDGLEKSHLGHHKGSGDKGH